MTLTLGQELFAELIFLSFVFVCALIGGLLVKWYLDWAYRRGDFYETEDAWMARYHKTQGKKLRGRNASNHD